MIKDAYLEEADNLIKVRQIRQSNLDPSIKRHRITELYQSNLEEKISSLQVIVSTLNPMLGSSTLLIPVIYNQVGMVNCTVILFCLFLINYSTSNLLIMNVRQGETDLLEVVQRILGKKYVKFYALISSVLMYLVAVVYFLLMSNMVHGTFSFFFLKFDWQIAQKDKITFEVYSYQYTVILLTLMAFFLVNMKNLNTILKLGSYGFTAVIGYIVFIFVKMIQNLVENGSISEIEDKGSKLLLVTDEIQKASGTLALSFLIQNCVISIFNKHEKPQNSKRDLFIAYFLAFLIYSYIGIFGQIGILGKTTSVQNTVMDFFPSDDTFALVI